MTKVLFVVHPGSCCDSLQASVGRLKAAALRAALIDEIRSWRGPLVVMDGFLSDELREYPALDRALKTKMEGVGNCRFFACDSEGPHFSQVLPDVIRSAYPDVSETSFVVTGAWHDPAGRSGCVTSTADLLRRMGYEVNVSPHAIVDPECTPVEGPSAVPTPGEAPAQGLRLA